MVGRPRKPRHPRRRSLIDLQVSNSPTIDGLSTRGEGLNNPSVYSDDSPSNYRTALYSQQLEASEIAGSPTSLHLQGHGDKADVHPRSIDVGSIAKSFDGSPPERNTLSRLLNPCPDPEPTSDLPVGPGSVDADGEQAAGSLIILEICNAFKISAGIYEEL